MGINPDSKDPADIEKAAGLLQKIRPFIRKFHSSEYINALANGEICLAVGYSGDILQAKTRADEAAKGAKKKGVELDYVLPKEGALMWFDSMSIPKDAPHVENAHIFMNYLLRPEIAARNSNAISYANGNLESQKFVDKDVLGNPSVYPDAETMKKLYITSPYPADVQRVVTRAWTRVKSGR
jgi:putrescine transport system substrate-binding protein